MSQTTLPAPASKKPLLKRTFTGHRLRGLPVLPEHPEFPKKVINDAYIVLITVLKHDEYFQVTKKRIQEESGLSWDKCTAALQYLKAVNIMGKGSWRGNGGLKGWCWRVDLDGNVEHNGTILHYSQERDERIKPNAKADMRRRRAGLEGSKKGTRRTKRKPRQCSTEMAPSEAPPLYPYNVQPCIEGKKETPFIPASGENFQSLPGDPQESRESQDNPDRQDPQEEVQTTAPVREDVLEDIEYFEFPRLDPVKAPAYYTRLGMCLDQDNAAIPSVEFFGKRAIQQLQQGPRPRGKAALRWFRQNLPGQLLEDCLQAGETLTVTVAHKLVRKLHQGTLSIDHFARYWAAVKTQRCKRQPLAMVVEFLRSTFSVKDERDAEWVTSAAARVHDEFGPALYWAKHFSSLPGAYIPGLGRDTVTHHWAPAELCTYLHTYRPARLSEDDPERLLWATRIRVMTAVFGRDNTAIAPLARDLVFSGITDQDIQRWLIESHQGRQAFFGIHEELQEKHKFLDTAEVFGLDAFEHDARVWLLWLRMQTVRVSQENLMYPDTNIHDFCRF